jgi:hypothetical protein
MRTRTLLRQRSDHRGPVLRLTVSACRWYSDTALVLSDRWHHIWLEGGLESA